MDEKIIQQQQVQQQQQLLLVEQEQHEQTVIIKQQQQLQAEEEILIKSEKIKKKKKKVSQQQQITQEIQEIVEKQAEQKETRIHKDLQAHEMLEDFYTTDTVTSIQSENIPYETIQIQTLSQETIETTALTQVLQVSTERPEAKVAHADIAPVKTVAIQEESSMLEVEEGLKPQRKRPSEKLHESITEVTRRAAEITEVETKQNAVELVSERTPKVAQAQPTVDKSETVLVEKPLIEDTFEDLPGAKMSEEHVKPTLVPHISQQQLELTTVDALGDLPADILREKPTEKATTDYVPHKSVIVEQLVSSETTGKHVIKKKVAEKQIPIGVVMAETSVEVVEVQPQDTTAKYDTPHIKQEDAVQPTLVEHLAYVEKEEKTVDKEDVFKKAKSPLKLTAKVEVTAETVPLEVTQSETADTVLELKAKKMPDASKALENLIVQRSLIGTQPDLQSPLEEVPKTDIIIQKAVGNLTENIHVVGAEITALEERLTDLIPTVEPKLAIAESERTHSLIIGQISETLTEERTEALEQVTPTPGTLTKTAITAANAVALRAEDLICDATALVESTQPSEQHTKLGYEGAAPVANIGAVETHDKEMTLPAQRPKTAEARYGYVEQTSLSVKTDLMFEATGDWQSALQPIRQIASHKQTEIKLAAPNVLEVQPQVISESLETDTPKQVAATKTIDTIYGGLSEMQAVLETHTELKEQEQQVEKALKPLPGREMQPLAVYEIQITETDQKLTLPEKPVMQALHEIAPETYTPLERSEVLTLDTTNKVEEQIKPHTAQAEFGLQTERSTKVQQQTALDAVDVLVTEELPVKQTISSDIELSQPLEIITTATHDKESILTQVEAPAAKEALTITTDTLPVADTESTQPMEAFTALDETQLDKKQAHYGYTEIISTVQTKDVTLESTHEYTSKQVPTDAVASMELVSHRNAFEVISTNFSEKEVTLSADVPLTKGPAEVKINELTQKSAITQAPYVHESAGELTGVESLETTGKPTTDSSYEISIQQESVYEKEASLEPYQIGKEFAATVTFNTEDAKVIEQSLMYEHEQTFDKVQPIAVNAQAAPPTENLKLPLSENVYDLESVGAIDKLKLTTSSAISQYQNLNETIISEIIAYEDSRPDAMLLQKHVEEPLEAAVTLAEHAAIASENIIIEDAQLYEDKPTFTKKNASEATSKQQMHAPLLQETNLLDAATALPTQTELRDTAKPGAEQTLLTTNVVKEENIYEQYKPVQDQETQPAAHANIGHATQQLPTIQAPEIAEREGNLKLPKAIAPQQANEADLSKTLGLPIVSETNAAEAPKLLETEVASLTEVKSTLTGAQHEVQTTQVQTYEQTDELLTRDNAPTAQTNVNLENIPRPAQVETLTDVYTKEGDLERFKGDKQHAKPYVEGMYTETITSDVTAFEKTNVLDKIVFETKAAKPTIDGQQQLQVEQLDVVLDKENTFEIKVKTQSAKPYIEGTQHETLITEMAAAEQLSDLPVGLEKTDKTARQQLVEESMRQAQTISTQILLEKETPTSDAEPIKHVAKPLTDTMQNDKIIAELTPYEGVLPFETADGAQPQHASASLTTTLTHSQITTLQETFTKEQRLTSAQPEQLNASLVAAQNIAHTTEETIGLNLITETYDLKQRPERIAHSTYADLNESKTVTESLSFEQATALQSEERATQLLTGSTVPTDQTKSAQKTDVNIYESIQEEVGDFKPHTVAGIESSIVLRELKAPLIDEITVKPALESMLPSMPKHETATANTPAFDNLSVSAQIAYESAAVITSQPAVDERKAQLRVTDTLAQTTMMDVPIVNESAAQLQDVTHTDEHANVSITTQHSTYLHEQTEIQDNLSTLDTHTTPTTAAAEMTVMPQYALAGSNAQTYEHAIPHTTVLTTTTITPQSTITPTTTKTALQTTQFIAEHPDTHEDTATETDQAISTYQPHITCDQSIVVEYEKETTLKTLQQKAQQLQTTSAHPNYILPIEREEMLNECVSNLKAEDKPSKALKTPITKSGVSESVEGITVEVVPAYHTVDDIQPISIAHEKPKYIQETMKDKLEKVETLSVKTDFGKYKIFYVREISIWRITFSDPIEPLNLNKTHITHKFSTRTTKNNNQQHNHINQIHSLTQTHRKHLTLQNTKHNKKHLFPKMKKQLKCKKQYASMRQSPMKANPKNEQYALVS